MTKINVIMIPPITPPMIGPATEHTYTGTTWHQHINILCTSTYIHVFSHTHNTHTHTVPCSVVTIVIGTVEAVV